MSNIEKIRQEIERQLEYFKGKEDDTWDDCDNYTDEDAMWYQGHWKMCSRLLTFIESLPEETCEDSLQVKEICKENPDSFTGDLNNELENYYGRVPDDDDKINAARHFAEWGASQMPMPEDTVIFQKGVAEGRRLEREDNNKALAEMYGYEGGTESPLVKITFTIPKEQVKNLMPIKQGDVFGIENLTNKEGRR